MQIAKAIKKGRANKGMKKTDLARKLNIAQSAVSNWEKGDPVKVMAIVGHKEWSTIPIYEKITAKL